MTSPDDPENIDKTLPYETRHSNRIIGVAAMFLGLINLVLFDPNELARPWGTWRVAGRIGIVIGMFCLATVSFAPRDWPWRRWLAVGIVLGGVTYLAGFFVADVVSRL
ncbi:hypothetical protein [Blastopirellula marina]|uniref:Uncharacterized protein n=1 Tax=Blastopirellula marina TaxID=124 RepID=A0A2S8F845_9BACT|nr:hypothetical protein [Blastopirellula marina]PQO28325.1 hypothetical protein C5Y98_25865 [Blastopirellula marina]PTL41865.1 hypothetical protein C5Y97_25880 [Blastopirellula marina]